VGSGVFGTETQIAVNAIKMVGSNAYVGGNFNSAGGSSAGKIARWDGTQWHPLGSGLTGQAFYQSSVNAIEDFGGNIIAGGYFNQIGGTTIGTSGSLAKWDGTNWSKVATFSAGYPVVNTLASIGGTLWIGGGFAALGGTATNVVKWNGSGTVFTSGHYFPSSSPVTVAKIKQIGSDVWVGGDFLEGGNYGSSVMHGNLLIAQGGTAWVAPQGGVAGSKMTFDMQCVGDSNFSLSDKYFTFETQDSMLMGPYQYYVWYWSMDEGAPMSNDPMLPGNGIGVSYNMNDSAATIASLTASFISSQTMGNTTTSNPSANVVRVTGVWGGATTTAPNVGNSGFTRLSYNLGASPTNAVDGLVRSIESFGSDVVVGGTFYTLGGTSPVSVNNIGRWTGSSWLAMGDGVSTSGNGEVSDLEVVGDNLLVGGFFNFVDGTVYTYGLATWLGADTSAPTVGNSGTITKSNITGTGLTLDWTKATDSVSSQANLQYLAYYSLNSAMASVANIEANGTAVGTYTADINTKAVTGLTSGSTYYFNVIVKDEAGNKAAYSQTSQAMADTTAPTSGNSGTITTASVTETGLTLNWTKATDAGTAQANLQYLAYYSNSSSFDSILEVEAGTAVGTYTADINTKPVTGLTAGTTYYFNVIVKDEAGNKAVYTKKMQATPDSTSPVVGNSGIITTSGVGQTGVTLNWTKATDAVTAQANLQYLAYYSLNSAMSSVANIEANGTAVGTYTADINTKAVTGLTVATTYYFNVIVKDEVGNKAAYAQKLQATSAAETTVIDGDNATVGDGETVTWGSLAGGLTLTAKGEVLSGGEVILQLTSLDDLTGTAYFIEVKAGASLTFDGKTIIPNSGTIYRLRPRT
jgi:hypothetical protein